MSLLLLAANPLLIPHFLCNPSPNKMRANACVLIMHTLVYCFTRRYGRPSHITQDCYSFT